MRRQDAATQEPTNQVFGGDAHGLSLPQARSTQPRRAALALGLHDNFCSFLVFKVFSCQFKFRAVINISSKNINTGVLSKKFDRFP